MSVNSLTPTVSLSWSRPIFGHLFIVFSFSFHSRTGHNSREDGTGIR